MIKLRPYQNKAVDQLRELMINNKRRLVMCSPTGSGKTVIFSYMCQRAVEKSKRVLIVTDRIELINQAGGTLQEFGLKPIEIKAGKKLKSFNGLLFTGMAQTLCRRIKLEEYQTFFKKLDLIIFDECHKQTFSKLFEYIPDTTTVIGATATPHRATNQESLEDFYQAITEVCPIGYLIKNGFLSKANSYGVQVDLSGIKTKGGDFDEKTMGDKYDELIDWQQQLKYLSKPDQIGTKDETFPYSISYTIELKRLSKTHLAYFGKAKNVDVLKGLAPTIVTVIGAIIYVLIQ